MTGTVKSKGKGRVRRIPSALLDELYHPIDIPVPVPHPTEMPFLTFDGVVQVARETLNLFEFVGHVHGFLQIGEALLVVIVKVVERLSKGRIVRDEALSHGCDRFLSLAGDTLQSVDVKGNIHVDIDRPGRIAISAPR